MADIEWTTEDVRQEILRGFREGSVVRMRRAARFDAAMAAHDAEVAAKALEEYADQMASGYNASTLNAERRAIKREIRARAAALRRGGQ